MKVPTLKLKCIFSPVTLNLASHFSLVFPKSDERYSRTFGDDAISRVKSLGSLSPPLSRSLSQLREIVFV